MEPLYKQLLATHTSHVFTKGMTKDQWLLARRKSIGGSDAGAVMGLNKWASALTVYLDKKGLNHFDGNGATERGSWLEQPIREKAKEALGVIIEECPVMFTSVIHPFMSANIDGLVYIQEAKEINGILLSGLGGHEIKTTQRGDGFSAHEIPDSFAQVQHYMAVLNLPWFILSAYFIERHEFCHYVIQRDEAFISLLIETEKQFWEHYIEKDVMPAPSGIDAESELIADLFEGSTASIVLDAHAESLAAEYLLINQQLKDLENKKAQIVSAIKLKIIKQQNGSEEPKVRASAGKYTISFSKSM
ncbi:MAG: YqaJ viral recombinase family protein [Treponema sp.]